jgi:hypothetical protein
MCIPGIEFFSQASAGDPKHTCSTVRCFTVAQYNAKATGHVAKLRRDLSV